MSVIVWEQPQGIVSLVVNTDRYQQLHYVGGDISSNVKRFPQGIFCNPSLEKREYLKLAKIYHPDVSSLTKDLASEICKIINATKDGHGHKIGREYSSYRPSSSTYSAPKQPSQPQSIPKPNIYTIINDPCYKWVSDRYGVKDWEVKKEDHSGECWVIKKAWYVGSSKLEIIFILRLKQYPKQTYRLIQKLNYEFLTVLDREICFNHTINFSCLKVAKLKQILKNEGCKGISKKKKADLVKLAAYYFSLPKNHFKNIPNWTVSLVSLDTNPTKPTKPIDLIVPTLWNDNEAIRRKQEKEKHAKKATKSTNSSQSNQSTQTQGVNLKDVLKKVGRLDLYDRYTYWEETSATNPLFNWFTGSYINSGVTIQCNIVFYLNNIAFCLNNSNNSEKVSIYENILKSVTRNFLFQYADCIDFNKFPSLLLKAIANKEKEQPERKWSYRVDDDFDPDYHKAYFSTRSNQGAMPILSNWILPTQTEKIDITEIVPFFWERNQA